MPTQEQAQVLESRRTRFALKGQQSPSRTGTIPISLRMLDVAFGLRPLRPPIPTAIPCHAMTLRRESYVCQSVFEVPHPGKDHGQVVLVGSSDHFLISH